MNIIVEELDCEVRVSEGLEEGTILLVSGDINKCRHRFIQKAYGIAEYLVGGQSHVVVLKVASTDVKGEISGECITGRTESIHFTAPCFLIVCLRWLDGFQG